MREEDGRLNMALVREASLLTRLSHARYIRLGRYTVH